MIKIIRYDQTKEDEIFTRSINGKNVSEIVSTILADVQARGDQALREYTLRLDGVELADFAVSQKELDEAIENTEPEFLKVLEEAANNIRAYHQLQKRDGFTLEKEDGVLVGQKVIPIDKVGVYVPGGTAAYPSTVLMDCIPAFIAGCKEIVMVTPPAKDGSVNKYILAAAKIAGVNKIFKLGGAQAVAALSFGTETVPAVDKIVGPGNAFVAEAKKQVFGKVAIDMIAGPSEIMIVADGASKACYLAADMLSQAEHDKMATAVLITDSEKLALDVKEELVKQTALLPRREIAEASIRNNGKIIVVNNLNEAVDLANRLAPEHLELSVEDPFALLEKVRHAGSVFLGRYCPEAVGDYYAGPNHTLPTMGTARFSNPLSVDDFVKKTQFTYYTEQAIRKAAPSIAYFANKEGLTAHAESVLIRTKK